MERRIFAPIRGELIGGLVVSRATELLRGQGMKEFSVENKKKFSLNFSRTLKIKTRPGSRKIGFVRSESGQMQHTIRAWETMVCNNSGRGRAFSITGMLERMD